jgi:hypothetical protein
VARALDCGAWLAKFKRLGTATLPGQSAQAEAQATFFVSAVSAHGGIT